MARPNRSDVHLPFEEEAKRLKETCEYFDSLGPKRHSKPLRSDYSSQYRDALKNSDGDAAIPELDKLRELETDPQKLVYCGSEAAEEYVETEYYKDLNGVDKQHHTTGTGFIKMEKANSSCLSMAPESNGSGCHTSCKGNPATNEWIPTTDQVFLAMDKPNRSEN